MDTNMMPQRFDMDMDPKLRQDESPRLVSAPPPYEYQAEQRTDAHPRSFLPYLQEDPNDPATHTQVRRDSNFSSDPYRDRLMSDADSLLDNDEQHQRNTELYGRDYWQKDNKSMPPPMEPELPPRMAEFEMRNRVRDDMAEFEMKHNIHNDETPVINRAPVEPVHNRMDDIPVAFISDSPMMPTPQATQPVRMRPLMNVFRDLFMWRNIRNSAAVFSMGLLAISALMYFSFITIIAYSSLAVIMLAGGVVFGRQLLYTFQQKTGPHPFDRMLKRDVFIKPEWIHEQIDNLLVPMNKSLAKMRNLYLADSLAQTLKLGLFMYMMTYIGRWFNLMTLVMVGWIMAFGVPRVYMMFRPQIHMVWDRMMAMMNMVEDRVMAMFHQQKAKMARKGDAVKHEVHVKTTTTTHVRKAE